MEEVEFTQWTGTGHIHGAHGVSALSKTLYLHSLAVGHTFVFALLQYKLTAFSKHVPNTDLSWHFCVFSSFSSRLLSMTVQDAWLGAITWASTQSH